MSRELEVIVQKSGLDSTKANELLTKFSDYFDIAAEWELKAKAIVVTDESQTVDMQMARAGRLFLKEKRVAVEKTRKEMKAQALREGKAIDGIANVLKALIIPIEEHLDQQEHFVEIRAKKAEDERLRLVAEKEEADRVAKEKAEREKQERIRVENEKLKVEAVEKDRLIAKEKAKADKAEKERQVVEEEKVTAVKEAERLRAQVDELATQPPPPLEPKTVTCPNCGTAFVPEGGK